MARPSPKPPKVVPWARPKRSKTSCWCSLGMPRPRSLTWMCTPSPVVSASTSIGPPSGEYRIALERRFARTCSMRSLSAMRESFSGALMRMGCRSPSGCIRVAAQQADVPALLQTFAADPVIVLKSPSESELTMTIQAIVGIARGVRPPQSAHGPTGPVPLGIEPRSYAHLAGLLPRALERSVSFDVGAAVIARPGMEPMVDVHATSDCPEQTRELVRERALSLYKVIAGGVRDEPQGLAPVSGNFPLRSSVYFPLASEGGVVGLTYLASFRAGAFSQDDERVLAELASHASGAYRRLESSVHRLRLSPRQSQVLALIASGLSDKEVASRLGLAHRTVRTHIDRMLREHGLRSRTEAGAAWLRGQQG